jgi:hypothetical protein
MVAFGMRSSVLTVLAMAAVSTTSTAASEDTAAGTKPHVLLMLADDFSWGNIGVSGRSIGGVSKRASL